MQNEKASKIFQISVNLTFGLYPQINLIFRRMWDIITTKVYLWAKREQENVKREFRII